MKLNLIFIASGLLALTGCGSPEPLPAANDLPLFTGEAAARVRDETVAELLAISDDLREALRRSREESDFNGLAADLASVRPRIDYVRMRAAQLPEEERMVIRGNLAVATNRLREEWDAAIESQPWNDDLAMEIAHLRGQLSPLK